MKRRQLLALSLAWAAAACATPPAAETPPAPAAAPAAKAASGAAKDALAGSVPAKDFWSSPEALTTACKSSLEAGQYTRKVVTSVPAPGRSVASVLVPLNEISRQLSEIAGVSGLMSAVHPDKAVRDAAEGCEREILAFLTDMSLDKKNYEAIEGVAAEGLDAPTLRLREKTLLGLRLAGVDQDDATREKLKALEKELTELGQKFSRKIREDARSIEVRPAQLKGLPEDFIKGHPAKDGKVTLTTNYPDYFPVLTYAKDEAVRRDLTKAFLTRGYPDNAEALKKILALRYQKATLLGYPNWAEYNAQDKMAGSAEAIEKFTEEVASVARPRMKRDLALLLASKKKDNRRAKAIETWDRFYYVQKVRKERFDFDAEAARAYFHYTGVKDGILAVYADLFGLSFEKADRPVWHASVEAYNLKRDGKVIGEFYLDMHSRPNKFQHAAMFPMRIGLKDGPLPMASLVCNFPDPSTGSGLMEHTQVITFFHEFGHLIHHLLAQSSRWVDISGINTEWDFVEAPSQILEEWAWSPEVLQRFARHYETKEPIPTELVKKMRAASEFGQGVHIMRQIFYQAMSYYFHAKDPAGIDLVAETKQLQKRYSPYPYIDGTHVYASFGHLQGYSSVYYTYQWSLSLAKDMFTRFEKAGIMDRATARDYADKVLAPGGTRPAADLVSDFLGRPSNLDAYRKWLEGDG